MTVYGLAPERGAAQQDDPCRLLIADSQPVVRMGLAAIFADTHGLEVVGQVTNSRELFTELEAMAPDIVVIDPSIDGATGYEILGQIQDGFPGVSVVALTSACSDLGVLESLRSGAMAFLTKNAAPDVIVQAIRAVIDGQFYLDPSITSTVVGAVGRRNDRRRSNGRQLTERERAVLELLVEGKRNKAISEALHISERTVKFHVRALFQKLRASNRTEAVMAAVAQGLASPTTGKSS
ncbi:MAG: response regulator transcription factor [Chromatiales bacterium]|jgi:DNA-binding NarL/FixJ family response regulator